MTDLVDIAELWLARLRTVEHLMVFDADVPTDPDRDADGLVKPYAVLYTDAGTTTGDRLGFKLTDLRAGGQVNCCAGTARGALWAVDRVREVLGGHELIPGANRLREIGEAGPVRKDNSVPGDLRWYLPLIFRFATPT